MSKRGGAKKRKRPGFSVMDDDDDELLQLKKSGAVVEQTDEVVEISKDGRRATTTVKTTYKRRVTAPSDLNDPLATWIPMNDTDVTEPAPTFTVQTDRSDNESDSEDEDGRLNAQAADYIPMERWLLHDSFFLDELFYHDAYGEGVVCLGEDCNVDLHCTAGSIRCKECCGVYCSKDCLLAAHRRFPLHIVQEWAGSFWKKTTLHSLGLRYQLGHQGKPCVLPEATDREIVVIDITGSQNVRYRRCSCRPAASTIPGVQQLLRNEWYPATTDNPKTCMTFRTLDFFRLLNVIAHTNSTDFMTTIARLTDPTGLSATPVRSKPCIRMAQQWAYLHRAKRAGRAHCTRGLSGTANGEMAVKCWSCPLPGMNLPDGWDKVGPEWKFIYMLILSMDANFRLKNKIRKNEKLDPILGDGKGCFVESGPYKEHLKNYVHEKDISSCTAFAALMQRDNKMTTGLRVSGVGAVSCARHEVVRPNGIGDLQKGERAANMDYIFFCSIFGIKLLLLMISYDIACQWFVYLEKRADKIPGFLVIFEALWMEFGLPLMHALAHILKCGKENVLSTRKGVGKVDGEGCERVWSRTNGMAYQTKEMGEGTRHSFLEDCFDYQNMQRNMSQVTSLTRKLAIAVDEEKKQRENFEEIDQPITPEVRQQWEEMESAWLADRSNPNPYVVPDEAAPSEREVKEQLEREEKEEMVNGRRPVHGTSATAFIAAGIHLEEIQRQLKLDVKSITASAPHESKKIQDRRNAFLRKHDGFLELQKVYMPGAFRAMEAAEDARNPNDAPLLPEQIKLWLPSELAPSERRSGCVSGLPSMELRLRHAQCSDALREVRSRLHARQYVMLNRLRHGGGQRQGLRSGGSVERATARVQSAAEKYRAGRCAVMELDESPTVELKVLNDNDLKMHHEVTDESENQSSQMVNTITGSANTRPDRLYSSRGTTSWIWTASGAPTTDEPGGIHEAVRVEWTKAKMRKTRWWEEVQLLREEMRRSLRSLRHYEDEWQRRAAVECGRRGILADGAAAYAARQSYLYRALYTQWRDKWSRPLIRHGKWTLESQHIDLTDRHMSSDGSADAGSSAALGNM